jgi:hypothetical protein
LPGRYPLARHTPSPGRREEAMWVVESVTSKKTAMVARALMVAILGVPGSVFSLSSS